MVYDNPNYREGFYQYMVNKFGDIKLDVMVGLITMRMQIYILFKDTFASGSQQALQVDGVDGNVLDLLHFRTRDHVLGDALSFWFVYNLLGRCSKGSMRHKQLYKDWMQMEEVILSYRLSKTPPKELARILHRISVMDGNPLDLKVVQVSDIYAIPDSDALSANLVGYFGDKCKQVVCVNDIFSLSHVKKTLRQDWILDGGNGYSNSRGMVTCIKYHSFGLYRYLQQTAMANFNPTRLPEQLKDPVHAIATALFHCHRPAMHNLNIRGLHNSFLWHAAPRCIKEAFNPGVHINHIGRSMIASWCKEYGMNVELLFDKMKRTVFYYWTQVEGQKSLDQMEQQWKTDSRSMLASQKPEAKVYSWSCGKVYGAKLCPEYIGGGGTEGCQQRCQLKGVRKALMDIEDIAPLTAAEVKATNHTYDKHIHTPIAITRFTIQTMIEQRGVDISKPYHKPAVITPFTIAQGNTV